MQIILAILLGLIVILLWDVGTFLKEVIKYLHWIDESTKKLEEYFTKSKIKNDY